MAADLHLLAEVVDNDYVAAHFPDAKNHCLGSSNWPWIKRTFVYYSCAWWGWWFGVWRKTLIAKNFTFNIFILIHLMRQNVSCAAYHSSNILFSNFIFNNPNFSNPSSDWFLYMFLIIFQSCTSQAWVWDEQKARYVMNNEVWLGYEKYE